MENGVYKMEVGGSFERRAIQVQDGMIRMLVANSRHVKQADGFLHDHKFWSPTADTWTVLSAKQADYLAAHGKHDVQEVGEVVTA